MKKKFGGALPLLVQSWRGTCPCCFPAFRASNSDSKNDLKYPDHICLTIDAHVCHRTPAEALCTWYTFARLLYLCSGHPCTRFTSLVMSLLHHLIG